MSNTSSKIGRPLSSVHSDPLLGKISDQTLADKHGCSKSTVEKARRAAGMDPVRRRSGIRLTKTDWNNLPFGRVPDGDIASCLDVSRQAVSNNRRSRDIPSFWKGGWFLNFDVAGLRLPPVWPMAGAV